MKLKKWERSMNMIEIILALVIVVISFIPMSGIFVGFNQVTLDQKDVELAQKLCLEKIEEYKTLPFPKVYDLASSKTVESGNVATQKSATGMAYLHEMYTRFQRDVEMTRNVGGDPNVLRIDVFVYWHKKLMRTADERLVQLTTFITRKEF